MAEDVLGQRRDRISRPGRRKLLVAVAGVAAAVAIGVPVALAGQHRSGPPAVVGAPLALPSVTPFDESRPPSLPPLSEQAPVASPGPTTPLGVKGMPNATGCPVQAPRLLDALRDSDLYRELGAPEELTDVECYATYAVVRTGPDAGTVVFRYTEMTDSWRAVSGGTSTGCKGVPQAVRAHLRRCG